VKGAGAQLARGAWDAEFVPDEQSPDGGKFVYRWRDDLPVRNLFWKVGDIYLALTTDDEDLSEAELAKLAGSLRKR
jgi:hypothetical protein